MDFFPLYAAKLKATLSLMSDDEFVAYTLLYCEYMERERPFESMAQVYRIAKAHTPAKREACDRIIAEHFHFEATGSIASFDFQDQIDAVHAKSERARKAAGIRWDRDKLLTRDANGMRTHAPCIAGDASNMHGDGCADDANASKSDAREHANASKSDALKRKGKGKGKDKEENSNDAAASEFAAITPKQEVWTVGLAVLGEKNKPLIGQLIAKHTAEVVLPAFLECMERQPQKPEAWVIACLKRGGAKPTAQTTGPAKSALQTAWERMEADPYPQWALDAGFDSVWEADSMGCNARNAHEFKEAKRVKVAA